MKAETEALLKVASKLKSKGFVNVAGRIIEIGDAIEDLGISKEAQDLIDADCDLIETAFQEVDAANLEIKEAAERKKKWVKGIELKKGKFTEYCKAQGFKGPCEECARKALKSEDSSTRGMASFYLAAKKFKK